MARDETQGQVTYDAFGNAMTVAQNTPASDSQVKAGASETTAFWNSKGYDGAIFKLEKPTDEQLAKDADFIRAARLVYYAEEGADAKKLSNTELTEWTMGHMRAIKNNLGIGGLNMFQNMRASEEVQNAFKYVGDAYDHKDWTVGGLFSAIGWTIIDPTNIFIGARIGQIGLKAVKLSGVTGMKARAGRFMATTMFPAAGMGATFGSVASVVDQNAGYIVGAQDSWIDLRRTGTDAIAGAAFGAGLSGLGAGAVAIAPRVGRSFSRLRQRISGNEAPANTPRVEPEIKAEVESSLEAELTTALNAEKPRGRMVDGEFVPNDPAARADNAAAEQPNTPKDADAKTSNADNNAQGASAKPRAPVTGAAPLPEYKRKKNLLNHLIFRYKLWNPGKWIDEYRTLRIESAKTNPTPVIRPVFSYIDKSMEKFGITKGLIEMGNRVENLKGNSLENTQEAIKREMAKFADVHREDLQKFKDEMVALRNHVDQTYKTMAKNNGIYDGLVEGKKHKEALLSYIDHSISIAEDLQKSDFGAQGTRILSLEYQEGIGIKSADELKENGLHWLFTRARDSHARLHVKETRGIETKDANGETRQIAVESVNGIKLLARAEERDADIRKVATGMYVQEPEFKKRQAPENFEWTAMQAEEEYMQYLADDSKTVNWSVPNKSTFAQYYGEMIRLGYYQEALELADRTMRRKGSLGRITIPSDLTSQQAFKDEIGPELWQSEHFQAVKRQLEDTIASRKTGGKEGPGWGPRDEPGRRSEAEAIARDNYFFYMTRFAGYGRISTPAEITLQVKLAQNPAAKFRAYWLGMETRPSADPDDASKGQLDVYRQWWLQRKKPDVGEDATYSELIKHKLSNTRYARSPWYIKMPTAYASGGLTSVPGLALFGGSAGLVGLEKGYQLAFGDEEDTWIGDFGRWTGRNTLYFADMVNDWTWGLASEAFLPDSVNDKLDKFDLIDEANAFLFRGEKDTPDADRDQHIRERIVADEAGRSDEFIDEYSGESADQDNGRRVEYIGRDESQTGDSRAQAADEADADADTSADADGADADTSADADDTPTSRRRRTSSDGARSTFSDAASAAGDLAGSAFSNGFNWLSSGDPDSTIGKFGTILGGLGNTFTGMIGKMHSGQVENGREWLAAGAGLIAALTAGPWLKNLLGPLGKIPFAGLAIAALVFGYGGKLAHALMGGKTPHAAQGNGNHSPRTISASSTQRHGQDRAQMTRVTAPANDDRAQFAAVGGDGSRSAPKTMDSESASQSVGGNNTPLTLLPEPGGETMPAEILKQRAANEEINAGADTTNVVDLNAARTKPQPPTPEAPQPAAVNE